MAWRGGGAWAPPKAAAPAQQGSARPAAPQTTAAKTAPQLQQVPAAAGHLLAADQLFSVKERLLIDHRLRTPHRRHVDPRLLKVTAHWVTIPAGSITALHKHAALDVVSNAAGVPAPESREPPVDPVNVRAVLCAGLPTGDGSPQDRHILRRIEVIAANDMARQRHIRAYGGLCEAGTDQDLVAHLRQMVAEQCGVDLSWVRTWHKFLELEYRDAPRSIFFMPDIWEATQELRILPQTREVTETKAVYEDGDDAMDGQQPTRAVTQTKVVKTITPLRLALAHLLDFQVQNHTHSDTVELCTATDALDEFFKREMGERILRAFRRRQEEAAARAEVQKRRDAAEMSRKRRRDQELEARKKGRRAQEEQLKKEWARQDEGKTDDEKRAAMLSRQQEIRKLREQFREEDRREAEATEARQKDEVEGPQGQLRTNLDVINAFAYFDRTPGLTRLNHSLPHSKVENVLLCVDEKLTLGEVRKLIAVPGLPDSPLVIPYRALGLERVKVGDEEMAP